MSHLPAVTDASFRHDVLEAPGTVVVDFWADWCPPCRAIDPILDQLAAENPDITFVAVDADANPDAVMAYGALSLPTIKVFQAGEVVQTLIGARPKPAFEHALAPYFTQPA
jgi:thioredoxin 1